MYVMYRYNYVAMYVCMYVFYISLARKNGHGRLPEHNLQSINQSINQYCPSIINNCVTIICRTLAMGSFLYFCCAV